MHLFVPLSDETLFDHPERIRGPLVPFSVNLPCERAWAAPRHQTSQR